MQRLWVFCCGERIWCVCVCVCVYVCVCVHVFWKRHERVTGLGSKANKSRPHSVFCNFTPPKCDNMKTTTTTCQPRNRIGWKERELLMTMPLESTFSSTTHTYSQKITDMTRYFAKHPSHLPEGVWGTRSIFPTTISKLNKNQTTQTSPEGKTLKSYIEKS